MPETKTFTVAQLLVVSTAAQRPDHLVLPLPPTIRARGGAQRNLLRALLNLNLVEEVAVDDAGLAWRTDEAGHHCGLRLTAAGLAAAGSAASTAVETVGPVSTDAVEEAPVTETSPRRPTGKLGEVLQAISAEEGATLVEITTLTGWLPHTARAAVTGLRKRGFDVALIQQDGRKAYRLTAAG